MAKFQLAIGQRIDLETFGNNKSLFSYLTVVSLTVHVCTTYYTELKIAVLPNWHSVIIFFCSCDMTTSHPVDCQNTQLKQN